MTLQHKKRRKEPETPSQEQIIQRIENLTVGPRSKDWVTSGEIGEGFVKRSAFYRKLEQIRSIVDTIEAKHSTQLESYDHDGRPAWLYTYNPKEAGS